MLPSRWESFSGKHLILDLTHMLLRITRGPMQMERFRGMRFSRWRFSPIWRVELTGIARTSKILMKLDQSCFGKMFHVNIEQIPESVEQDEQRGPRAQHQSDAFPTWPTTSWRQVSRTFLETCFANNDDIDHGRLFRERLSLLCKGLTSYVRAEQEMFVILGKCQKEIIRWVHCRVNHKQIQQHKVDWGLDQMNPLKKGKVIIEAVLWCKCSGRLRRSTGWGTNRWWSTV